MCTFPHDWPPEAYPARFIIARAGAPAGEGELWSHLAYGPGDVTIPHGFDEPTEARIELRNGRVLVARAATAPHRPRRPWLRGHLAVLIIWGSALLDGLGAVMHLAAGQPGWWPWWTLPWWGIAVSLYGFVTIVSHIWSAHDRARTAALHSTGLSAQRSGARGRDLRLSGPRAAVSAHCLQSRCSAD